MACKTILDYVFYLLLFVYKVRDSFVCENTKVPMKKRKKTTKVPMKNAK